MVKRRQPSKREQIWTHPSATSSEDRSIRIRRIGTGDVRTQRWLVEVVSRALPRDDAVSSSLGLFGLVRTDEIKSFLCANPPPHPREDRRLVSGKHSAGVAPYSLPHDSGPGTGVKRGDSRREHCEDEEGGGVLLVAVSL